MKLIHILKTKVAAIDCEPLFSAAADLGVRIGWLELDSAATPPAALEEPAALGAFRAVGVNQGRVVAVKPVRGEAVVKDLLREHFAGCRLVVIRGELEAPALVVTPSGYRIRFEDGGEREFAAEALAKALRGPRLRKHEVVD